MSANILQALLIERYARRHRLPIADAARLWIGRRARPFRKWYRAHGARI